MLGINNLQRLPVLRSAKSRHSNGTLNLPDLQARFAPPGKPVSLGRIVPLKASYYFGLHQILDDRNVDYDSDNLKQSVA